MKKILEQDGYSNYRSVEDSRKVEEIYKEFKPDLVLLDLNMPHLDGFQVMKKLNEIEINSYVPVLVLTAQNDKENRLRALEDGAKDFVGTPFDATEVLRRIANILEVRFLHNQLKDQNSLLDEKVKERTEELYKTRLQVVQTVGRASEFRDNETGMHVKRMSHMSARLGREAGLNEIQCDLLLHASPMHDVGKIGIPDHILLKPGKLDADEWETMKTHSTIGAEILSGQDSDLMKLAKKIALQHHEKWDGSGYPYGLKGNEISLEARVVALCDVFDALTSERPYKKAWSIDDSMVLIEKEKGKHFDPSLVPAFKNILPEILEIKDRFCDPLEKDQVMAQAS